MTTFSPAERAFASAFAKTLVQRRKDLGLTQEKLALQAGIDRNHYQLMEHARSDRARNTPANPRMQTLIRLSKALEMPISELLADAIAAYDRVEGSNLGA